MLKIHAEIIEQLELLRGHWPRIARAAGLHRRTLRAVANRISRNPRADTLDKITFGIKQARREMFQEDIRRKKGSPSDDEGAAA